MLLSMSQRVPAPASAKEEQIKTTIREYAELAKKINGYQFLEIPEQDMDQYTKASAASEDVCFQGRYIDLSNITHVCFYAKNAGKGSELNSKQLSRIYSIQPNFSDNYQLFLQEVKKFRENLKKGNTEELDNALRTLRELDGYLGYLHIELLPILNSIRKETLHKNVALPMPAKGLDHMPKNVAPKPAEGLDHIPNGEILIQGFVRYSIDQDYQTPGNITQRFFSYLIKLASGRHRHLEKEHNDNLVLKAKGLIEEMGGPKNLQLIIDNSVMIDHKFFLLTKAPSRKSELNPIVAGPLSSLTFIKALITAEREISDHFISQVKPHRVIPRRKPAERPTFQEFLKRKKLAKA